MMTAAPQALPLARVTSVSTASAPATPRRPSRTARSGTPCRVSRTDADSVCRRHCHHNSASKIAAIRTKIQLSVGQVVLAIMDLPRYRHQTLADLMHVVLDPLMRDRVAIAYSQPKDAPDGNEPSVAGIAIWASVSDAVDAKITEQVKAGVFPVRLTNEDWVSGDTVWLLDVIAGDRKQATAVLANFKQVSGERLVKVHPIVARSVEAGALARMRMGGKHDTNSR